MNYQNHFQPTTRKQTSKYRLMFLVASFFLFTSINLFAQATITEKIVAAGAGTFTVPAAGLSTLTVEAWGGGGGGSGRVCSVFGCGTGNVGGGGGGGAYATTTLTSLVAGSTAFVVGAGGAGGAGNGASVSGLNTTYNTTTVVAVGGTRSSNTTAGGAGGLASACTPTLNARNGGNGGNGSGTNGGGGGGGAGNAGVGGNGGAPTAGTAGSVGGVVGGVGRTGMSGNGTAATDPTALSALAGGGGGGGATNNSFAPANGGKGANGMIWFTYPMPAPTIASFTPLAACGTGGSVIITGTNFFGFAGTNIITGVTVNGVSATITASSATSITITVPGGATTGKIAVTTSGGSVTSLADYTITPLPSVPSGTINNTTSPACPTPGVSLSASATPPGGVTWFWQTVNNGQSTALGSSASSLTLTTAGASQTRWLQAQDNTSLCWSATSLASTAVTVTTPAITLNNTGTPVAGGIIPGTNNVVLSAFNLNPTCLTYGVNTVTYTAAGTATASDLSNFRIFYDANGNSAIDGGESSVSGAGIAYAGSLVFTITHTGQTAPNRYLLVADVALAAVSGRTFTGSITPVTNVSLSTSPTTTLTGTATGNAQTIRPLNDECVNAIELTPGAAAIAGINNGGTKSAPAGLTACGYNTGTSADVWYKFTATCDANYIITAIPSNVNVAFGVFSASCGGTYIDCANAFAGTNQTETQSIAATNGTTYYINVWGNASTVGNFTISVSDPTGVTLSNTGNPAATNHLQGTNNVVLYGFQLAPTCSPPAFDFTAVDIAQSGTATNTDITDVELYQDVNANGTFESGTDILASGPITLNNPLTFNIANQTNITANRRYIVVGDISPSAIAPRTFIGGIASGTSFTISTASAKIGSATGTTQTIRPVNDNCLNAISLTPGAAAIAGTNTGATNSAAGAACGYAGTSLDVWYKFTATCDANYVVTATPSNFNLAIGAFSACGSGYLSCLNASTGTTTAESVTIAATNGTTYYINVWGNAAAVGNFTISLSDPVGVVMTNTGTPAARDIYTASNNVALSGFQLQPNCVTSYTPTAVTYTVTGSATATELNNFRIIYDANNNGAFDGGEVSVSGAGIPYAGSLAFTITHPGQTTTNRYLLVANVAATATPGSTFTGSIAATSDATVSIITSTNFTGTATGNTQTIRPVNDICAGAIEIFTSTPYVGSTLGAVDNNETGDCATGTERSVWYKYTATSSVATVRVTGITGFDPVLNVINTCGVAGSPTGASCADATADAGTEQFTMTGLGIGTTYYIQVHDWGGDLVSNGFTITVFPPPANDECSGAVSLTPGAAAISGSNSFSSVSNPTGLGTSCGYSATPRDVWYQFTSGNCNTPYTITVDPTTATRFGAAVFSGSCGSPTYINCNLAANTSSNAVLTFTASPNTTYYINVWGNTGTVGDFDISINNPIPVLLPITGNTGPICTGSTLNLGGNAPTFLTQTITASGTFTPPYSGNNAEVLVVGGGGGGGNSRGGGGGGGGVNYQTNVSITGGAGVAVVVGAGGGGGSGTGGDGGDGTQSSYGGTLYTAAGGGGGGGSGRAGRNGASGGGASSNNATRNGGTGISGQGFRGGNQTGICTGNNCYGTGGGGAGATGIDANGVGSIGGNGIANSITGSSLTYGGGGGGGNGASGTFYAGGSGGGGQGGNNNFLSLGGTAGSANTGGGGGGGGQTGGLPGTGGVGGSGVVIVKYPNYGWKSSDNTVASVSTTGVVTGLKGGTVTITYEALGGTGCLSTQTTMVTVRPAFDGGSLSTASQSICNNTAPANITYSTAPTGGSTTTFQWYRQVGSIAAPSGAFNGTGWTAVGSPSTSTSTLLGTTIGNLTATTTFALRVYDTGTPACFDNWAGNAHVITVNPRPTSATSGNASVCVGFPRDIRVVLTGTAPWNITFSDGFTPPPIFTSPYIRTVNDLATTTYTVTALSDANCTSIPAGRRGSARITRNACPNTWLGISNDWNATSNWSNGVLPGCGVANSTNVIIPTTPYGGLFPLVSGIDANADSITINRGATVSVDANRSLNVCGSWIAPASGTFSSALGNGVVNLNGTGTQTITGRTKFNILKSSKALGTATVSATAVVEINTALELQGNGNFDAGTDRVTFKSFSDMQCAVLDNFSNSFTGNFLGTIRAERSYGAVSAVVSSVTGPRHQMSSPLNSVPVSQFGASGTEGYASNSKCDETRADGGSPYGNFHAYDEAAPGAAVCGLQVWFNQTTGFAQNGRGYSVRRSSPGKITLTGSPNLNNSYTRVLGNSGWNNSTKQGNTIVSGYHIVGNPYLSNLNLNAPFSGFSPNLYIWVTNGPQAGTYEVYDLNSGGTIIPPFGTFTIRNIGGSDPLTLSNANRTRSGTPIYYLNNSPEQLYVNVTNQETGLLDKTLVAFREHGSEQYDEAEDAMKLFGDPERHSLFTKAEKFQATRNILPKEDKPATVPMGFYPGVSGDFSMTFDGVNSFPEENVILVEDKFLGKWHNVRNGNYTFKSDAEDNLDRFVLHFNYKKLSSVKETQSVLPERIKFDMYPNPTTGILFLETNAKDEVKIEITDINGRVVFVSEMTEQTTIDIANFASSVYQVKLSGSVGTVVKKLVKE
jgi:hypothetical protein